MSESTELIALPTKESALQVYSKHKGLEPFLAQIRAEIDGFVPDVSTRKGREAIASIAYKVSKSKTALDNIGKELVADLKELPRKVDAERKRMRDTLDVWRDEVRKPLTEWEAAEQERIAKHKHEIVMLESFAQTDDLCAAEIQVNIATVSEIAIDESWEEFEAEAHRVKAATLEALRTALAAREKYEVEQAELARLRAEAEARAQKEREERIAREAAERAKREAEAKAQAEREAAIRREQEAKVAAERRELELKLAAEKAEREKVEAQQRAEKAAREAKAQAEAAAAAERKRHADEAERIAAEQRKREADKAHRGKVNRAALQAFIEGGLPEDCAKQAVTLIAKGSIPAITINY